MTAPKHVTVLSVLVIISMVMSAQAASPEGLTIGEKLSLKIPDNLKIAGAREGYFYTHGPVQVSAYAFPCVIVIRDPSNPATPVASGTAIAGNPVYETNIPAGFYYINTTQDAAVLVGVSDTRKCNGYYHYRFTGEPYGELAESDVFYLRTTNGCENKCFLFAPNGASTGFTCCDSICLESCGVNFDLDSSTDYFVFDPGNITGYLEVQTGGDVMALARDDSGYFVPPHPSTTTDYSYYYTYQGTDDDLNIHSFSDGTNYQILSLQTNPTTVITSGTLNEGETYTHAGSIIFGRQVVRVRTTKGQASVSVLGGSTQDNTNYMTYVLDPNGHMQGSDFITKSHFGGFIYVWGLQDGTHIEVRNASTQALNASYLLNQGNVMNVNPGTGTWRIRADKDVTVCVGKGYGAAFIPLTANPTGSTPFPPVIAGVNWAPFYPRTSDSTLHVRWLTDENCTSRLSYRIGSGAWQEASVAGYRSEHQINIDLSSISDETLIRFKVHATDQSGSTTTDDNHGANYQVTVRKDAPDLSVTLNNVINRGNYETLQFHVINNGAGTANNGMLHCRLYGMQPFSAGVNSSYSSIASNRIDPSVPIPNLGPGDARYLSLDVMPYLSHTGSIDYRMTTCTTDAEDDWGHNYHQNHPAVSHDWNDTTVESGLLNADYVILANLSRFYSVHSPNGDSAQAVPRGMAQFANERDATLAYISSGDPDVILDYIQGRFHGKVHEAWRNGGYLLLIGCSAVMPAFGWHLECTFYDSFDLWMSDNTYANLDEDGHYTPELCIGRMTGDTPDTFLSLFTRAQTTPSFDKALSISGTGDGEGTFSDNAEECSERLDVRYTDSPFFRLNNFAAVDRLGVYQANTNNTDFLYYRNHGSVDGWDSLATWDVASLNFGGKFPIVYSNACLTGQIQTGGNLAHEFLSRCASVFIGATQVSPRSENNSLGNKITARHRDGSTIGRAFRNAKRDLAGDIHWYTLCINDMQIKKEILMYNLYGDPARGGVSKSTEDKAVYDTPMKEFSIEIPMYVTSKGMDGFDHVTIPDPEHGDLLQAINESIVPVYRWKALYAPGVRVNKITLNSRGGKSTSSGLILPLAWGSEKKTPGPGDVPSPGVFPPDAFHWTGIERPDGALEVVLTVHPFLYNRETLEATYYQNFQFAMDAASSKVSILSVTPLYESMSLQKGQEFKVDLYNGESSVQKVNLSIDITNMGTNELVQVLKLNGVEIEPGKTRGVNLTWLPAALEPTGYLATVKIVDANTGDERDVAYAQFRMGTYALTTTTFEMNSSSAGYVKLNEDVTLSMEVRNTGDIPNSVTSHLQIKRVSDNAIIQEWQFSKETLLVGDKFGCSQVWNTGELPGGKYQFVGWSVHRGGTAGPHVISFDRVRPMRMGWWLPKDVFNRGDKIMGTANLYREDGSVIGLADGTALGIIRSDLTFLSFPPLSAHIWAPNYSTSFIVNAAESRGVYGILSTAEKTGYQPALGGRWFVVDDEGFTMTANPSVAIADGISTVTITSSLVQDDGITIPDGSEMTLFHWTGSLVTPDSNPSLGGHQVASSGGHFEFEYRAPTSTSLDAFVYGTMGDAQPKSGVSVRFKGVDFNENRRVDVHDILSVQTLLGANLATSEYDFRMDLDENETIDTADRKAVVDRWGMLLAGDIVSDTITESIGSTGVILRLQPSYAVIPPGGNLSVNLVAEGLINLGGYEFTATMLGNACSLSGPPTISPLLSSTGNRTTHLGPVPSKTGYKVGAFATGGNLGPGGIALLGTVNIHADSLGQSNLILSSVLFSSMDGKGIPLKQAMPGVYVVGTGNPTPTPQQTATWTPVPTVTSTKTPTLPPAVGDTDGDGVVNMNDVFFFSNEWHSVPGVNEESCNPVDDNVIDSRDLLLLLKEWGK